MCRGAAWNTGQGSAQGAGMADWQEVLSDGTDPPPARAGARVEVENKKS